MGRRSFIIIIIIPDILYIKLWKVGFIADEFRLHGSDSRRGCLLFKTALNVTTRVFLAASNRSATYEKVCGGAPQPFYLIRLTRCKKSLYSSPFCAVCRAGLSGEKLGPSIVGGWLRVRVDRILLLRRKESLVAKGVMKINKMFSRKHLSVCS